ncbi:MAG: TldD/PmbA family protein [Candidatus Heimdallarchaeota archaeon]|nr:MAG: TldD/PmbA family protein [Candidatus Heimdallarchaeota archaeon]
MSNNFTEKALEVAQKEGATEVIARLIEGPNYQIRFSNSNIDISKQWDQSLLEVFLAIGKQVTQVDIQDPTIPKIEQVVSQATKFAKRMPDSEMYATIESNKHSYKAIDGLYDKTIESFPEKAPEMVNVAIQKALEVGAERVAGVLYFGKSKSDLLTSYGNSGSYDSSFYRMTIRSFVDFESSGQDVVVGRNMADIEKQLSQAGENAGKLAKMAVGGKQGKAGKYDLILSPTVGGNLFGQITDGANPLMLLLNMSPLGDHFGEQITPENFNVVDDPHISEGLGSKPFDVEGTPTSKTPIIQNGVLTGLIHNTTSGIMMQTETTGNSNLTSFFGSGSKFLAPEATNMVYSTGDYTLEEIIAESKKPTIYITSNWYTRYTNMIEGEFSTIPRDGMFLIEDGEIKKPIRKLRISENLLKMSKRIEAVGKDRKQICWWEVYTPTFIPTIKIADCNISAATQ